MKNLKISWKLATGFGSILLLYIISVIFGSVNISSVTNDLDLFYKRPFVNVSLAIQIDMNSEIAAKNMLQSCVEEDLAETSKLLDAASEYMDKMTEDLAMLKANYTGNTSEVEAVETAVKELETSFAQLEKASRSNDIKGAYEIYTSQITGQLLNITALIGVIRDHASQTAATSYNEGMSAGRNAMILMSILGVAAVVVGVILAVYITRSITSVIRQLEKASENMSQGGFDNPIMYESKDELGMLTNSLREMESVLKAVIQDIGYQMGELSGGNLAVHSREEKRYVGELHPILMAIRKMRLTLNETIGGITSASDQVNAGADQVSSAAQALAQGATEQASSVEELAATINEISRQVTVTAQHAETAKRETENAHEEIGACSSRMNDLVGAMKRIEEKSNEVGKIIKVIEDISFQTNILALNAAVEAARAGSAGKGFAVVADEVRNLASKSAEAAKNTTTLIEEAIMAVEEGTKISGETEEALGKVVTNAAAVLEAVVNISSATTEQSEGILQITQGIDQISSVVQTNSATAEESAAASEELSGQAQMLKELVSVFKLDPTAVH